MTSWTFDVPVDVSDLNPNRRLHHMARARIVRIHKQAAWLTWVAAGRPKAKGKVRLDFVVMRSGKPMDQDNLISSCKAVIDGICTKDALTPDDSAAWVAIGSVTERLGRCYALKPKVVVTATEIE